MADFAYLAIINSWPPKNRDGQENPRFDRPDDHPRPPSSTAVQTLVRRKLRRPSELDLAELATRDWEPVLDRIAGPIAAAWSRM